MDILKLAREAGFIEKDAAGSLYLECWPGALQRFADFVLEEAALRCDEREARWTEKNRVRHPANQYIAEHGCSDCAAAIRAMKGADNG